MNYFLILVILAMGGGAYYEYTQLQQTILTDDQQLSDLTDKATALEAKNKKLADDDATVSKNLSDAQAQISKLTTQLEAAQGVAAQLQAAQEAAKKAVAVAPTPNSSPNNLGTIATLDGKTFQNCQLLAVDADGITFNHSAGITKVVFSLLPPELQKRFGYDPQKATALTEAQIQYQEQQRKAAAAAAATAGGN